MSRQSRCLSVLALCLATISCDLVTFETLDVTSNVSGYNEVLGESSFKLEFSIEPDSASVENLVTLKSEGKTVTIEYAWTGSRVDIHPRDGWENGRKYVCSMNGSVLMGDGRKYSVDFIRSFFYQDPAGNFTVLSFTPGNDALTGKTDSFEIVFSKPVSVASFIDNFKLYPDCEKKIVFSANNTVVSLVPKTGWAINTVYQWSLDAMLAEDGFSLARPWAARFRSIETMDYPAVLGVSTATPSGTGYAYSPAPVDGNILSMTPIGIIFSKDMDLSAIATAVSFDPDIKGYCTADPAFNDRIVFIPEESYKTDTRYKLQVSTAAKDSTGLPMKEPFGLFFTSGNPWLRVISVSLDGGADISATAGTETVTNHVLGIPANPADDNELTVTVRFSSGIDSGIKSKIIKNLQVLASFPSSADIPYLAMVSWNPGNTEVTMTWRNFSVSSGDIECYYLLKINGGESGMNNGRGEFLREDVCVYFRT